MIWGSEGKGLFVITSVWFFRGTLNLRQTWPDKQATVYLLLPSPHLTFNLLKNVNRPQMYKCSHALGSINCSGKLGVICVPPPLHLPRTPAGTLSTGRGPPLHAGTSLLTLCGPLSELQPLLGCNQLYKQTISES